MDQGLLEDRFPLQISAFQMFFVLVFRGDLLILRGRVDPGEPIHKQNPIQDVDRELEREAVAL